MVALSFTSPCSQARLSLVQKGKDSQFGGRIVFCGLSLTKLVLVLGFRISVVQIAEA